MPVAEHGDRLGHGEDLVETVRDEDDAGALLGDGRDRAEQPGGLRRGKRRGRLVEHEDAAAAAQRPPDLDELPLGKRQLGDPPRQVDCRAEAVEHALHHGAPPAAIDEAGGAGRQGGSGDILLDGAVGEEHQFLMHHREAGFAGLDDIAERHLRGR